MNPYCNLLSLPFPPLREGFDIKQFDKSHVIISIDEMHPEMKELLYSLGITVTLIELFHREPGNTGSIHTDYKPGDFTKINWVYGGENSRMLWYNVKDPSTDKNVSNTIASTNYIEYSLSEVTLAHTIKLTGSALVQVGVPHLVVNPKEHRYCLCFVLADFNRTRLTMQQSQELLSNYIEQE
jgi:hypothetical protein